MTSSAIKAFIKGQLGCSCPDDVFSSISICDSNELVNELPVDRVVEIGGRLLVIISQQYDWFKINNNLEQIIHAGILFRDRNGFNRFRLVIATDDEEVRLAIQQSYDLLTGKDEKTHIHFVTPKELPDELAERAE
jgi:hypothetical protein